MVAHLWLRTHKLVYEETGNIILTPWKKAACYDDGRQPFSTYYYFNSCINDIKNRKIIILN